MSEEGDRSQAIQSRLDRILAGARTFDEAAPKILQALCERLGWDVGIVWKIDDSAMALRFVSSWHPPSAPVTELEKLSARSSLSPGVGLPGRVLSAREPSWIKDVQKDRGFPRATAAMEDGIHGAFGFPLLQGRRVVGIIELFSHDVREINEELLLSMAAVGEQVGQLLGGESKT